MQQKNLSPNPLCAHLTASGCTFFTHKLPTNFLPFRSFTRSLSLFGTSLLPPTLHALPPPLSFAAALELELTVCPRYYYFLLEGRKGGGGHQQKEKEWERRTSHNSQCIQSQLTSLCPSFFGVCGALLSPPLIIIFTDRNKT